MKSVQNIIFSGSGAILQFAQGCVPGIGRGDEGGEKAERHLTSRDGDLIGHILLTHLVCRHDGI